MSNKSMNDEIDHIVEGIVEDPKKAEALKDALHKAVEDEAEFVKPAPKADDEGDDMWDNMPV